MLNNSSAELSCCSPELFQDRCGRPSLTFELESGNHPQVQCFNLLNSRFLFKHLKKRLLCI